MPAIPEDLRLQAFAAAACHIEPAQNKDDIEEALKVHQTESDEQLKEDLKLGFLTFEKLGPKARLQAYYEETLPEDLVFVLNPTYLLERELEAAPPLFAETMFAEHETARVQQDMAAQQAALLGMPPPPMAPLPPAPPGLWPHIFRCRKWLIEHFLKDFRDLNRQEERRYAAPV